MRVTINIPDALHRELKSKAACEGRPVEELILRGVEGVLCVRPKKRSRRISLPIVVSKQPGTLQIDNAKIFDLVPFP